MSVAAIRLLIALYAIIYNVPQPVALEVARLESDYNVTAQGDGGDAVGIFQWHKPSWDIVRRAMGETTEDLRLDARENIRTAMYAMGPMKLGRWWSTWQMAEGL